MMLHFGASEDDTLNDSQFQEMMDAMVNVTATTIYSGCCTHVYEDITDQFKAQVLDTLQDVGEEHDRHNAH